MNNISTPAEPEVLIHRDRGLGRITLNRPRAINALNHAMVLAMTEVLTEWAHDDTITDVVLDGAGDRGLCAGGDIRAIYQDAKAGGSASNDFWRDEYRLNSQIAHYPKPFIALMDGLVMGGGVGLSSHASHRVVTDTSMVGMPEVKIGLVPDVGGSFLLARAPGKTGMHVALTAASINGDDAIAMGLADRKVPHQQLDDFVDRIAEVGADAALAACAVEPDLSPIISHRAWIDECYAAPTVVDVLRRLRRRPEPQALQAAESIATAAPLALTVTFRAVLAATDIPTLEAALNQDYRMVYALLRSPDLIEGIRAQVIDKDRNPRWSPASLDQVTDEMVSSYFAPTPTAPFDDSTT